MRLNKKVNYPFALKRIPMKNERNVSIVKIMMLSSKRDGRKISRTPSLLKLISAFSSFSTKKENIFADPKNCVGSRSRSRNKNTKWKTNSLIESLTREAAWENINTQKINDFFLIFERFRSFLKVNIFLVSSLLVLRNAYLCGILIPILSYASLKYLVSSLSAF